jgi:lipopolysaccharide/colanic/teichoic acid biosynthesis glycosyltransferase
MKRIFDLLFAIIGILFFCIPIFFCYILCSLITSSNGFFLQKRVGQYGSLFTIIKLKTIHPTTQKIHPIQAFFRKYKIDEVPQLLNVLIGNMSIVGPRPDIPGYYDNLIGEDRKILLLKPGLTCEASLYFFDEEDMLLSQSDPKKYNDTVVFVEKVRMNLLYAENLSLFTDIKIILKTIIRIFFTL